MISSNSKEVADSLDAFEKEITRKLESMVRNFAVELATIAVDKTPIGDSKKFSGYYQARTTLPDREGLSKSNWQYTEDTAALILLTDLGALNRVSVSSEAYKLGDTFSIVNTTPYIEALEAGKSKIQAPDGIMTPTIQTLKGVYEINLKRSFDNA